MISSAGSEHLAYTEGVGSSNLSSPTYRGFCIRKASFFMPISYFFLHITNLAYSEGIGSSPPGWRQSDRPARLTSVSVVRRGISHHPHLEAFAFARPLFFAYTLPFIHNYFAPRLQRGGREFPVRLASAGRGISHHPHLEALAFARPLFLCPIFNEIFHSTGKQT